MEVPVEAPHAHWLFTLYAVDEALEDVASASVPIKRKPGQNTSLRLCGSYLVHAAGESMQQARWECEGTVETLCEVQEEDCRSHAEATKTGVSWGPSRLGVSPTVLVVPRKTGLLGERVGEAAVPGPASIGMG